MEDRKTADVTTARYELVVRGDELSERFALGFERMDLKGEYGRTVVVGAHLPLRKT